MRARSRLIKGGNHHELGELTMKKVIAALLVSALLAPVTIASAATPKTSDLVKPIHQFIDGFNTGDTKSAFAAYATGDVSIIDEFAPHAWMGPDAAKAWAAEYDKHAADNGITDGIVKYGKPRRIEVEGDVAYVIVPTVYTYKEKGKPIAEEGQMTFALKAAPDWKITAWTWSGVKPHPAK